jgi:anti-anti-sigma regulatory factor
MTTRITRLEDEKRNQMVLKIEGTLTVADAKLLEEICEDVREELGYGITIDLAGIAFLGYQSAAILCRLKNTPRLKLQRTPLFVQQIIESAEAEQSNAKERDGE